MLLALPSRVGAVRMLDQLPSSGGVPGRDSSVEVDVVCAQQRQRLSSALAQLWPLVQETGPCQGAEPYIVLDRQIKSIKLNSGDTIAMPRSCA